MIKIHDTTASLNAITTALDRGQCFYTRYGDNDIMQMSGKHLNGNALGDNPMGGNQTVFSPELQAEIKDSFLIRDSRFLKGVSCSWPREPGMRDGCFLPFPYNRKLQIMIDRLTDEKEFLSPILFHYLFCFRPDLFHNFVNNYLKPKNLLYIGSNIPEHVKPIIGVTEYVFTPAKTAYAEIDEWWVPVENYVNRNPQCTVIPTVGQCSRVVAGRLWKMGFEGNCIDMGSLFDVFIDPPTRTWLKIMSPEIRKRYENTR